MIIPWRASSAALALTALSGCTTFPESSLAPPPPAISIAAPLETTWESTLDQLTAQGIAVRTLEKGAGFIATETVTLPPFVTDATKWADCGTFAGFRYAPTAVDYTVFVRGDSTGSSSKASARYRLLKSTGEPPVDCVSTGVFEASFGAAVKQRAETMR
jgi:hypothetical protein